MPKYLVQASYTASAIAAMVSNPQDRVAGVKALCEKMGTKFISLDFAFGDDDVIAIIDCPDDVTAAASAMAVIAPGHLKSYKSTRLLSPDEFVAAQKLAAKATYRAP